MKNLLDFNSFFFFLLLFGIILIYWALNSKIIWQNVYLLVISYLLYSFTNIFLALIILGVTLFNFLLGNVIEKSTAGKKKPYLTLAIIGNVIFLGFFKYYNFFVDSIINLIVLVGGEKLNLSTLNILFPIGISYYIFTVMGYNIDVYRGKISSTKNFIDFALFIAFFPKIISGPIERADHFIPQITQQKTLTLEQGVVGFDLILLGLFKKIIISDTIALFIFQKGFYQNPSEFSSLSSLFMVLLYSIQIYTDFSGYTDIAIGISKLLGYNLSINFLQPYFARNIKEFWRRWHISLTSWFKDYVYIPLGGNKVTKKRIYLNMFIVFFLSGLWHGAGYNYVLWGIIHGLCLILYLIIISIFSISAGKYRGLGESQKYGRIWQIVSIIGTFFIVSIAWIFFSCPDLHISLQIIQNIFFFDFNFVFEGIYIFMIILTFGLSFGIDYFFRKHANRESAVLDINWALKTILYIIMIIMIITIQTEQTAPFIYQGF